MPGRGAAPLGIALNQVTEDREPLVDGNPVAGARVPRALQDWAPVTQARATLVTTTTENCRSVVTAGVSLLSEGARR